MVIPFSGFYPRRPPMHETEEQYRARLKRMREEQKEARERREREMQWRRERIREERERGRT